MRPKRFLALRTIAAMSMAVAVLDRADIVRACGPFINSAVFAFDAHPDLPLTEFAGGALGILRPTYARSYLVVAYRYLTGGSLSAETQQAVSQLWRERTETLPDERPANAAKAWLARRAQFVSEPATLDNLFRRVPTSQFTDYLNCGSDAFERAMKTLDGMAAARGRASAAVVDWVHAQDVVFVNCEESDPHVPDAAGPGATGSDAAQRVYQIAAAQFYAGQFTEAEAGFRRISTDRTSPWRTIAPYLVARTLIRRATLTMPEEQFDRALLARADREIQQVLADTALSEFHPAARRLRGFVRFRLEPEARVRELGAALTASSVTPIDFKQELADYTLLLDKFTTRDVAKNLTSIREDVRSDAMTDWIATFQTTGPAALDHAFERWSSTRQVPWLLAVASQIQHNDPRARDIRNALAEIKWGSPAFVSAAFHLERLKIDAGEAAAAREDLDALLPRLDAMPRSAANGFLSLRTRLATSIDEFLRFSVRRPAGLSDGTSPDQPFDQRAAGAIPAQSYVAFDADAVGVLNDRVALSQLIDASRTMSAPNLRRQLTMAAWTRAVLLGDTARSRALSKPLGDQFPAMRADLTRYGAMPEGTARALMGVVIMLRYPGTGPFVRIGLERETAVERIDDFRDNWWCARDEEPGGSVPEFLTPAARAAAADQRARLRGQGTAPNYLATEAVRLAALLPRDPAVPEALHLAVRSTRFGCTDRGTGAASRRAFQYLHTHYPQSEWTKKTPYWFQG